MIDYILKGTVIDGISEQPIENGAVAVENGKIVYVGNSAGITAEQNTPIYEAETILPGFMDCHIHLEGGEDAGPLEYYAPFGDLLLASAYEAGLLLDSGFTAVRDMSRQGFYLSRAQRRGILRAPHIMPGGLCLSITSGHGDMWTHMSREQFNEVSSVSRLCDGVDDCILAVREQFRNGAEFIKIIATGGVSSPADGVEDVQFSQEEMRAIVEEAKRRNTYVAAHCTGNEGAYQALIAGVSCIEHGVMLTQREIDLMAERNVPLVTTLHVSLSCAELDGPDWFREKASKCAEANIKTIEMARKAGITIALGTDFSNSPTSLYHEHGKEFVAMVKAGMTPMEAIKAGTINAAQVMRREKEYGSLEVGKKADIVMVKGNPLEDISCLANANNVVGVFQDGIRRK